MLAEEFRTAAVEGREPKAVAAVADDDGILVKVVEPTTAASVTSECMDIANQIGRPLIYVSYGMKVSFRRYSPDEMQEPPPRQRFNEGDMSVQECLGVYVVDNAENVDVRLFAYRRDDDGTPVFYDDPTLDGTQSMSRSEVPQRLIDAMRWANAN
jgi:hypothetical protein